MKKINFISLFDKGAFEKFKTLQKSLKQNYNIDEYNYFAGVDEITYLNEKEYFDKNDVVVKNIDKEMELLFGDFKSLLDIHNNVTSFALARMVITKLFPELSGEAFIYLDADIMFGGRISEKYLNNKNFGFTMHQLKLLENWSPLLDLAKKAPDYASHEIIKKIFENKFFNTGVLIVNEVEKYESLMSKMIDPSNVLADDFFINFYNNDEFEAVYDETHNFLINLENLRESYDDVVLFHFAWSPKPWHNKKDLDEDSIKKYERAGFYKLND